MFRSSEVCEITGITYRKLDYWVKKGYVWPSVQDAHGSGSSRIFSGHDVNIILNLVELLDEGYTLKTAAEKAQENGRQSASNTRSRPAR